jgi:hypothetical protein
MLQNFLARMWKRSGERLGQVESLPLSLEGMAHRDRHLVWLRISFINLK